MVWREMNSLDCICFGSIILDYRKRLTSQKEKIDNQPLELVYDKLDFTIGGISILAIVLSRMGFKVAVAGQAGKDIPGYGIKTFLENNHGVNTEAVRLIDEPTSHSIINLTSTERYIKHNIGANMTLDWDDATMAFIRKTKPALLTVGYAGLLPEMDRDNGEKIADLFASVKKSGVKTALDTHTMNDDYSMLVKPLRRTDIFFCNATEGKQISGRNNPREMLMAIIESFPADDADKYRIMGITLPDGVYIAYGNINGYNSGFVPSPWHTEKPHDLTGAGDAFRAGFYAYLIKNMSSFDNGTFTWQDAGMLGNLTASIMITQGYESIRQYPNMLTLACYQKSQFAPDAGK